MKTRPSKTKCFISPSPTISYTITKKKKRVFCDAKVIEVPEAPEGPLRVLFRFHSDSVLFRFLSDRLFFRVPCNRFLCWVISDFFPACRYFLSKRDATFLLKTDVRLYIILSKITSHLTISS